VLGVWTFRFSRHAFKLAEIKTRLNTTKTLLYVLIWNILPKLTNFSQLFKTWDPVGILVLARLQCLTGSKVKMIYACTQRLGHQDRRKLVCDFHHWVQNNWCAIPRHCHAFCAWHSKTDIRVEKGVIMFSDHAYLPSPYYSCDLSLSSRCVMKRRYWASKLMHLPRVWW
jgi:hypothetical protein